VERFGWRFAPADKVMQVANDYEKEGIQRDVGTVETIDADASELTVALFPPGIREQRRPRGDLWLG